MLSVIYAHQNGRIRGSRRFDIQRGVKQGDVLSPLLFNAGVEAALRKWKIRVVGKGIYVDDGEALTNIRYADDIMLFATSPEDLLFMITALKEELARIGLSLNASKTKVLTTLDDIDFQSMVIDGEPVDILSGNTAHKYLGRKLCGNLRSRNIFELAHRVQIAWMRFHKNRDILMDKHLSIYSRLKFFQAVITPTILFGLTSCALTAQQLESLDVLQRKMLRSIVGWVRIPTEDWSDTMSRMREKVNAALQIYPMQPWSSEYLRRQFRMVCRFAKRPDEWAMRVSHWKPRETNEDTYRKRGRPATRWDDRLNEFARWMWDAVDWQTACVFPDFPEQENEFVQFHSD